MLSEAGPMPSGASRIGPAIVLTARIAGFGLYQAP